MADVKKIAIVGNGAVGSALAGLAAGADLEVLAIEQGAQIPSLDGCDLVVEALPEQFELKARTLAELAEASDDGAVLVTSTNTLNVTDLALASGTPARVVGLCLSLPVDQRTLAEVVATPLA